MSYLLEVATSGIDFSLPGNGGPDCLHFISLTRRFWETLAGLALSAGTFIYGFKKHQGPPLIKIQPLGNGYTYTPGRIFLLVAMTFAFALEVAYKLSTKQFIFVVNPCHLLCVIQILLLALPPTSRLVTYLFRFHLYFLHGPVNAFFFPVTNTLFLPGEVFTYWLEHVLLLTIPFYLLKFGGDIYSVEPFRDIPWIFLSFGVWGIYHFFFLESLSVLSLANLNSMLCPAISDPFYGTNWRLYAIGHQFVLNMVSGKLFGLFGRCESRSKGT